MKEPHPIPFVRGFAFTPGEVVQVSKSIQRIVAPNPGPFTGTGTNTYLVGRQEIYIVDPGPDMDAHLAAIVQAANGRKVMGILATHQHLDHTALVPRLQAHFDCPTFAFGPPDEFDGPDGMQMEEGSDRDFFPDHIWGEGDGLDLDCGRLDAVHTPGHVSNHLCFAIQPDNVLLTGDHVLSGSTSVVIPPDGCMNDYLRSLARVRDMDFAMLLPAHGEKIEHPQPFLDAYIAHRHFREAQIREQLQDGPKAIMDMVPVLYAGLDKRLFPAAALSLFSHLIRMTEASESATNGEPDLQGKYWLS